MKRAVALAAATAALAACVAQDTWRSDEAGGRTSHQIVFVPLQVITAARLAPGVDRTGTPLLRAPAAPLTSLIHPAAVALAGADMYIADIGARALYRLDGALSMMAVVPGVPVALGTRLAVGNDFSLYVLDPLQRRVHRFSRGGRLLATYADEANLAHPVALAVDDMHGEIWVGDQVFNHLIAFRPLGNARQVVSVRADERNRAASIAAMALAAGVIYISDALCRCVHVIDRDGYALARFGEGELGEPGPIAVDRHGRVLVVDRFHNSLKVYAAGRLAHESPAATMGVARIGDIAVDEDRLMIADASGARVVVLRITAPRATE